jgi:hypothetical protein
MINRKSRILYYIFALLILLSTIMTLLNQQEAKTTKKLDPADTTANYRINSAPLTAPKQGLIDSH